MTAACDNRHCPERGVLVIVPEGGRRRCKVCGWLMRIREKTP